MQLDQHHSDFSLAATGNDADLGAWGQSYPQSYPRLADDEQGDYSYEAEEFFLEDTPRVQRRSTELDSVSMLLGSTGIPSEQSTSTLPCFARSRGDSSGDDVPSLLAHHHIRGFTQTEQTSVQVGSGVVHSFSVVTISIAQSRDSSAGTHWFVEDDSFKDDFEITLLDEQATTVTGRSSVRSAAGCVVAVIIAGGAVLMVGAILWAAYAASEAVVNRLCDAAPHERCLGGRECSAHEADHKSESITAPLLKV